MGSELRLSQQSLQVLALFVSRPRDALSGADFMRETNVGSGTLYPFLSRLEKAGWVTSSWEEAESSQLGRPRRRLYRLEGKGYNAARVALAEVGVIHGEPSWTA